MPVCSYLVYPLPEKEDALENEINTLPGCELTPSEDGKMYILVTESDTFDDEKILSEQLKNVKNAECMALVFGNVQEGKA